MARQTASRIVAATAAIVGWIALALQLVLIVRGMGLLAGIWRFAGFFTILTNLGAAAVATAVALGYSRGLGGARARLMAATSILIVGSVYTLALRELWNPTGLQKVAERDRFRHIAYGIPSIGGRYSVLSDFGLVPAARMTVGCSISRGMVGQTTLTG